MPPPLGASRNAFRKGREGYVLIPSMPTPRPMPAMATSITPSPSSRARFIFAKTELLSTPIATAPFGLATSSPSSTTTALAQSPTGATTRNSERPMHSLLAPSSLTFPSPVSTSRPRTSRASASLQPASTPTTSRMFGNCSRVAIPTPTTVLMLRGTTSPSASGKNMPTISWDGLSTKLGTTSPGNFPSIPLPPTHLGWEVRSRKRWAAT